MVAPRAIEKDFPFVQLDRLAELESWRKELGRPLYHIHKWWAHRLGSVFRAAVLGACLPRGRDVWAQFHRANALGRTVLDPFMGSGTTIGEALKLGCRAIGCDINPVSGFMVRQALTRVPLAELEGAYARLEQRVAPAIRALYRTTHPVTDEPAALLYAFWVREVRCPSGAVVPLLPSYVFSRDAYPKRKPIAHILCRACGAVFRERHDATAVRCEDCGERFNPQEGTTRRAVVRDPGTGAWVRILECRHDDGRPRHRLYALMGKTATGDRFYRAPGEQDHARYQDAAREFEQRQDALPLPRGVLSPGYSTDQARAHGYRHWREFFNPRQLLALATLLQGILEEPDPALRGQLLVLFSGTLEFNNMFCTFKGEGTGAVRHMFAHHVLGPPKTPLEGSVWGAAGRSGTFAALFRSRLLRAKRYLDEPFELTVNEHGRRGKKVCSPPIDTRVVATHDAFERDPKATLILTGDSGALPLPDACVDAVVTDPPYFDFVHYSELADFFYAWLAPHLQSAGGATTRRAAEVQDGDTARFQGKLTGVFAECRRVLRDDGALVFSFHHSRPEGWLAILRAVTDAGFRVVAAHPVRAEMGSASPKRAARDPITLDAMLVCTKATAPPAPAQWPRLRGAILRRAARILARFDAIGRQLGDGDVRVILRALTVAAASRHERVVRTRDGEPVTPRAMLADVEARHPRFAGAARSRETRG